MKIWAIGDPHLSFHNNINKPMDVFGYGWKNHAERLKELWLERVRVDDIVVIPGDISWGLKLEEAMPDIEWLHELPGLKLISKGNHDLWWNRINYLNSLYDDVIFLQNDAYYVESEDICICATRGWPYPGSDEYSEHDEKIYRRELLRLRMGLESAKLKSPTARIIAALHYPPSNSACRETEFTKILEEFDVDICLYGHLHGGGFFTKGPKGLFRGVHYCLVSMDYLAAKPKLIYDSQSEDKSWTFI